MDELTTCVPTRRFYMLVVFMLVVSCFYSSLLWIVHYRLSTTQRNPNHTWASNALHSAVHIDEKMSFIRCYMWDSLILIFFEVPLSSGTYQKTKSLIAAICHHELFWVDQKTLYSFYYRGRVKWREIHKLQRCEAHELVSKLRHH